MLCESYRGAGAVFDTATRTSEVFGNFDNGVSGICHIYNIRTFIVFISTSNLCEITTG